MNYQEALTAREDEVLDLVPLGFTNKAIAGILCISTNTLRTHLNRTYAKLNVPATSSTARIQAVLKAGKLVYSGSMPEGLPPWETVPSASFDTTGAYIGE